MSSLNCECPVLYESRNARIKRVLFVISAPIQRFLTHNVIMHTLRSLPTWLKIKEKLMAWKSCNPGDFLRYIQVCSAGVSWSLWLHVRAFIMLHMDLILTWGKSLFYPSGQYARFLRILQDPIISDFEIWAPGKLYRTVTIWWESVRLVEGVHCAKLSLS